MEILLSALHKAIIVASHVHSCFAPYLVHQMPCSMTTDKKEDPFVLKTTFM